MLEHVYHHDMSSLCFPVTFFSSLHLAKATSFLLIAFITLTLTISTQRSSKSSMFPCVAYIRITLLQADWKTMTIAHVLDHPFLLNSDYNKFCQQSSISVRTITSRSEHSESFFRSNESPDSFRDEFRYPHESECIPTIVKSSLSC